MPSASRFDYETPSIRRDGRVLALGTDRGVALWDLARGTELAVPADRNRPGTLCSRHRATCSPHQRVARRAAVAGSSSIRTGVNSASARRVSSRCRQGLGIAEDRAGRIVAWLAATMPSSRLRSEPFGWGRWTTAALSPSARTGNGWRPAAHFIERRPGLAHPRRRAGCRSDDRGTRGGRLQPRWEMADDQPSPCRLWAVGTWNEARQIGGTGLCFSPDSRLVVVQDASKVLRLVETETGRTVARLESPDLCDAWDARHSAPTGRAWS